MNQLSHRRRFGNRLSLIVKTLEECPYLRFKRVPYLLIAPA